MADMTSKMLRHFLLIFDHDKGELTQQDEYDNAEVAAAAYVQAETDLADRGNLEIVLIGADSIETVMQTHAGYFTGSVKVTSKFLAGVN